MKYWRTGAMALLLLGLATGGVGRAAANSNPPHYTPVHLDDDSDWWSARQPSRWPNSAREQKLSDSAAAILGISIWNVSPAAVFSRISVAPVVSRGSEGDYDDGNYWEQVCYESASGRTRLVFEQGGYQGLVHAFHLFTGGRVWTGSKQCVKSALVTENVAMPNGLRLGLTRAQVEAILGKPSRLERDSFEYAYSWTEPPDQPISIDLMVTIDVRFSADRARYLGVISFMGD